MRYYASLRSCWPRVLWGVIGAAAVLVSAAGTLPFGKSGIPVKGFKVAEPYGPPHEDQTKSLLEGGKALVLPSGNAILSDGILLHLFSETNTLLMLVRADDCVYNASNRVIHSAGPIHMQSADGKFTIEGTGFLWRETNSSLIISNLVHTVIESALLHPATNSAQAQPGLEGGPLFIDSGNFEYDGSTGRGVWRDKVRAIGTNLVLNSASLTAEVPVKEARVRALVAERDVAVDYEGIYATAQRLNYNPDTGLIRLTDQATWRTDARGKPGAEPRQGRGDELVIDRTNQVFQVNGHAWLKLPGQALAGPGFLAAGPAPAAATPPMSGAIDITCAAYEVHTNWAIFREHVRLEQQVGNALRGWLTCDKELLATFAGTNELQTLTADRHVVIEQPDPGGQTKRFTAGHAFYTQTNSVLELTQNPAWWIGPTNASRQGKGELIRVNLPQNEMWVRGDASLILPANELGSQLAPKQALPKPKPPPRAGTNEFAQIFSDSYLLRTNNSVFLGGVYVTHPEMNWSCEKLTVQLPTVGTTNLVAEQDVVFELLTQKGEIHGKGDNAVYSFGARQSSTNGWVAINELKLTGAPAIISGTNGTFQNPLIIWDRAREKLTLPGSDYRIQGYAKAIDTNIFMLKNRKRKK